MVKSEKSGSCSPFDVRPDLDAARSFGRIVQRRPKAVL